MRANRSSHLIHQIAQRQKDIKRSFDIFFKGFLMGIADVIPGVSGGTIAFILGIYEELIYAIRSFDLDFLRLILKGKLKLAFSKTHWNFLVPLLSGIAMAIILFSKVATWLLAHHTILVHSFFFGLILATIPLMAKAIGRWRSSTIIALLLSSLGSFYLVQMSPASTPETLWFIFLSGAVAICAMILPGISGAFMLLLLGKYQFMLNAIHQRDILIIFIFCLGMLVGILSFVRILGYFFKRWHDLSMAILVGFVIGSLNKIWPWKEVSVWLETPSGKTIPLKETNILPLADQQLIFALFLITVGFLVAYMINNSNPKNLNSKN